MVRRKAAARLQDMFCEKQRHRAQESKCQEVVASARHSTWLNASLMASDRSYEQTQCLLVKAMSRGVRWWLAAKAIPHGWTILALRLQSDLLP